RGIGRRHPMIGYAQRSSRLDLSLGRPVHMDDPAIGGDEEDAERQGIEGRFQQMRREKLTLQRA
ncbi:hypothetical protein, partial [Stenotrophomonas maltophilia]|uniref:hypothetical protein n=1 Tax=Stenotrophomonas maltophilia TaxID=40324 RepID=UPI0013D96319